MKKWIVRLSVLFVVLILVGLVVAFLSLNTLVKSGVEKVGPLVTQTDVKLESANISPFSGSGELRGLMVGNPTGYKTPSAIKVGDVKVSVNVKSVLSSVVTVDSVSVEGAEVTFEGGLGGNNLSKLLDNINSVASSDEAAKKPAERTAEKPAEGGKKLKVKDILIKGTKVNASLTGMGGKALTLSLPEIHMTDIGTDGSGVSSAELASKIIHEILTETVKAVGSSGNLIGKEVQTLGKGTGTQVEKAAKGFKSFFKK